MQREVNCARCAEACYREGRLAFVLPGSPRGLWGLRSRGAVQSAGGEKCCAAGLQVVENKRAGDGCRATVRRACDSGWRVSGAGCSSGAGGEKCCIFGRKSLKGKGRARDSAGLLSRWRFPGGRRAEGVTPTCVGVPTSFAGCGVLRRASPRVRSGANGAPSLTRGFKIPHRRAPALPGPVAPRAAVGSRSEREES